MLKRFFDRRLGPVGLLVVAIVGVGVIVALTLLVPHEEEPTETAATPTATVAACVPVSEPFGEPPDSFTYEKVDEATRAKTVKALNLDDSAGKVDMRKATRGGLTLGQLVAVPGKPPDEYASSLVAAAASGGAEVTRGAGFAIVPLESGQTVAVGVRGCNTILINAQDPEAVKFLAANVFSAS